MEAWPVPTTKACAWGYGGHLPSTVQGGTAGKALKVAWLVQVCGPYAY